MSTELDEAIASIVSRTILSAQDVSDLLLFHDDPEGLAAIDRGYRAAGRMPDKSTWDVFMEALTPVSEVAAKILPIIQVVTALVPVL